MKPPITERKLNIDDTTNQVATAAARMLEMLPAAEVQKIMDVITRPMTFKKPSAAVFNEFCRIIGLMYVRAVQEAIEDAKREATERAQCN